MAVCETCIEREKSQGLFLGIVVSVALHLAVLIGIQVLSEKPKVVRVIELGKIIIYAQKMAGTNISPKEI